MTQHLLHPNGHPLIVVCGQRLAQCHVYMAQQEKTRVTVFISEKTAMVVEVLVMAHWAAIMTRMEGPSWYWPTWVIHCIIMSSKPHFRGITQIIPYILFIKKVMPFPMFILESGSNWVSTYSYCHLFTYVKSILWKCFVELVQLNFSAKCVDTLHHSNYDKRNLFIDFKII